MYIYFIYSNLYIIFFISMYNLYIDIHTHILTKEKHLLSIPTIVRILSKQLMSFIP